nr:hypothetical protein [Salinibacter ruber]
MSAAISRSATARFSSAKRSHAAGVSIGVCSGSLIKDLSFVKDVTRVEWIPIRHIASNLLRRAHNQIQPESPIQKQLLQLTTNVSVRPVRVVHHEQVDITVGACLTPGMRAKENNLRRLQRRDDAPPKPLNSLTDLIFVLYLH